MESQVRTCQAEAIDRSHYSAVDATISDLSHYRLGKQPPNVGCHKAQTQCVWRMNIPSSSPYRRSPCVRSYLYLLYLSCFVSYHLPQSFLHTVVPSFYPHNCAKLRDRLNVTRRSFVVHRHIVSNACLTRVSSFDAIGFQASLAIDNDNSRNISSTKYTDQERTSF